MGFKTPGEIAHASVIAGKAKTLINPDKLLILGFLAGAYIALGGMLAIAVGGGVNDETLGLGVQKLLFAGVFPVGLMLVVIGGAELFTGNCLLLPIAAFPKEAAWNDVFKHWFWVYLGNFIGSVFIAYFLVTVTRVFAAEPWHAYIIALAERKVTSGALQLFWSAVGCNWLVCLAVWLAMAADDIVGKIFAIWFPTMSFVAIGFEHSVANMFFIPTGMFAGADVSLWQFLFANLLPVTLGNIVGGLVFVAGAYYYLHVRNSQ
ncbi:formate transporter [candidate division KSB3 bacterium]|uniref:Formate transporter n=1 Tax=candidate division KSB3 bacterium TaxID=2044937 RepID=A0A2G6KE60_9BACT|nr:MAG: formate transporter [candidate division KSB3 bacterium]